MYLITVTAPPFGKLCDSKAGWQENDMHGIIMIDRLINLVVGTSLNNMARS